jgi:hypothetical protein
MSVSRMLRCSFVMGLALVSFAAMAAGSAQQQRQRAFAKLPDWTGIWIADDGIMTRLGLRNDVEGDDGPTFKDRIMFEHPPYNAEWESKYQAALANRSRNSKECGFHFPGVMESPWMFEVLITPEQTAFIFAGREIRHIYTDGRSHPPADELWPLAWGDSVGHWEGDTLVIDTISTDAKTRVSTHGPILSEAAHFTERVRMVNPGRLENEMTITDPTALTRSWKMVLPYTRVKTLNRMIHGDCMQNDRNPVVDGQLTITP